MSESSNSNSKSTSNSNSSNDGKTKGWRKFLVGSRKKDATTQCGQWLQVKKTIDTDLEFRDEVVNKLDNVIKFVGVPNPRELTPEDVRIKTKSGKDSSSQHITDIAVMTNQVGTCKWDL